ncbi:MAG: hypothetical protein KAS32_26820 [Candidatus Peribacteraceae bacterium]|nr:hypothetical protein [Candidatus Peribacteraceae bacterium]
MNKLCNTHYTCTKSNIHGGHCAGLDQEMGCFCYGLNIPKPLTVSVLTEGHPERECLLPEYCKDIFAVSRVFGIDGNGIMRLQMTSGKWLFLNKYQYDRTVFIVKEDIKWEK